MSENMRKLIEIEREEVQKELIRAMAEEKLSLDVIANICKISPKRVEEILAGG